MPCEETLGLGVPTTLGKKQRQLIMVCLANRKLLRDHFIAYEFFFIKYTSDIEERKIEQKILDTQVNIINNFNYKPFVIVYEIFLYLKNSTF